MDSLELFPDLPRNPTRLKAWKEQYGVWTHYADMGTDGGDWLAILIPKAHEELKGYSLSDDEKADPISLHMGFCRLLDEWGLAQTGDTELEACQKIAAKWQLIGI